MKSTKLKIILNIFFIILLIFTGFQIKDFPGGMFFSGFYFGIIFIFWIFLICSILSIILKLILKKYSFSVFFVILSCISLLIFNIYFYSPTLKIVVPNDYTGEVHLVLANVKDNILDVDKNGIGYINEWTFNSTYTKPKVYDKTGNDLSKQIKGFNNLIFWTNPAHCCIKNSAIKSLNFEILPKNKTENPYKFFEITKNVNLNITKTFPLKKEK